MCRIAPSALHPLVAATLLDGGWMLWTEAVLGALLEASVLAKKGEFLVCYTLLCVYISKIYV